MSQFTDIRIGSVLYRYVSTGPSPEPTPNPWLVELAQMLDAKQLTDDPDPKGVLAGLEVLHRVESHLLERIRLKQRQAELG